LRSTATRFIDKPAIFIVVRYRTSVELSSMRIILVVVLVLGRKLYEYDDENEDES